MVSEILKDDLYLEDDPPANVSLQEMQVFARNEGLYHCDLLQEYFFINIYDITNWKTYLLKREEKIKEQLIIERRNYGK